MSTSSEAALGRLSERLRRAQQPESVVELFGTLHAQYVRGETGKFVWADVTPAGPGDVMPFTRTEDPAVRARGEALLSKLVIISLNGGLGTTMKLSRAKSLIPVRDGHTFLGLTAMQVFELRKRYGAKVPWLLMHSFHTQADCLAELARLGMNNGADLPLDFMQHQFPRIQVSNGEALSVAEEASNWAPPGHGDVFYALDDSGTLDQLIARGYEYAFVSNVDNLGGTVDSGILGLVEEEQLDFLMEVTDRTLADVKGGPLARYRGRLMLLEGSQIADQDWADFQDYAVFDQFNTNSHWWRLSAVRDRLRQQALTMPMIVNPKTVQGIDVVQLELAMGGAISAFDRARGLRVPRSRFAPVKATWDLLPVRSDAYILDDGYSIRPNPARDPALGPPLVSLDKSFYQGLPDFEARFPAPPSLCACRSLHVEGDVTFGTGIRMEGDVTIICGEKTRATIPDGTHFGSGTYHL